MNLIRGSRLRVRAVVLAIGCVAALLALPMVAAAHSLPRALSDAPWGANTQVNDDAGTVEQYNPDIAVDPSGNAYAVWGDYRNGIANPDIYFSYRPAGGSWGTNVKVNDDAGVAHQTQPSIAVDPSGNAYAVWDDDRNDSQGDIYFSYRPAGGDWGENVRVTDDAGTTIQDEAYIAADPTGNAYAVWRDYRNADPDIYFSYRPAGGDWGENVRVNDDAGTAEQIYPSIAADPTGNAYAVWRDYRNVDTDIYFSYRPAGGDWGDNARVNDDAGTANQYACSIATDLDGNAYAVWQDRRTGDWEIYFSYLPAGRSWTANVKVSKNGGTVYQEDPYIAVDPCGNAHVVWIGYSYTGVRIYDVYSSYRPAGGSWGASVRVNDDVEPAWHVYPSIGVDSIGNAYAVWQDDRNENWDIYSSYLPAPVPCVAEEEFVPEWGSIALLGSGLAGLAGYATLRLGSRQGLRWRKR